MEISAEKTKLMTNNTSGINKEIRAEKAKLMTNNTTGINTEIKVKVIKDSHKLQVPGLSYKWLGFQTWTTLQDSTDNSSIDKV